MQPSFSICVTNFNHGPTTEGWSRLDTLRASVAFLLPQASPMLIIAEYYAATSSRPLSRGWLKSEFSTRFFRTSNADCALRRSSTRHGSADRGKLTAPHERAAPVPHVLCHGNFE